MISVREASIDDMLDELKRRGTPAIIVFAPSASIREGEKVWASAMSGLDLPKEQVGQLLYTVAKRLQDHCIKK